jgi:hypothetical protein
MQRNNIDVRLLIKGRPITEYFHNGSTFVEGRDGSTFEIELTNRNQFRVEAVISVDGLSVLDGKEAGEKSSGYLLEANETLRVPGWKLDNQTAAEFFFAGKSKGYAAQSTGSSQNSGVIGVLAFKEKSQYRDVGSNTMQAVFPGGVGGVSGGVFRSYCGTPTFGNMSSGGGYVGSANTSGDWGATMLCSAAVSSVNTGHHSVAKASVVPDAAALNNLSAGFGQATQFSTNEVSFQRGDMLCVAVLYYDSARGLRARGIQVGRPSRARYNQQPQAFPGMNGGGCTPPAGWAG